MVNLFPDLVKHDTPYGRKASYFYVFVLVCSLLAAALYYSLAPLQKTKTASSKDDFFGLEMYQGTTDCNQWYSCLYNRSEGVSPTVTDLVCQCKAQSAKLSHMTQYPNIKETKSVSSDWCQNVDALEKYSLTLVPVISGRTTEEDNRAFNFFSSQTACNSAHATASSADERIVFTGATQATILQHMISWQAAAAPRLGSNIASLHFFSNGAPTSSTAAAWLLQDAFLEIDVSANRASEASLGQISRTRVALGALNSTCDARLFWPLVLQINSQCKAKKNVAEGFISKLDQTYIISSTLLNEESFKSYHTAQRNMHSSALHTPNDNQLLSDSTLPSGDPFARYLRLDGAEDQKSLDYLQLYHPLFSDGHAFAFAEYTQKFVLQYFGSFIASEPNQDCVRPSSGEVENPACQLTFEQTLNSVFPLTDSATPSDIGRTSNIDTDTASRMRASIFHPTRTAGSQTSSSSKAHTLTFKHIFGRGTLLDVGPNGEQEKYHDLTPLVNDGSVINTSLAGKDEAYTNGKYTITDPNNLKQKVLKDKICDVLTDQGDYASVSCTPAAPYLSWYVKVVSMEAKITSLKVIWKHSATVVDDKKLKAEILLRKLLNSMNASSSSRPQFDVGVSSLSLNSGTIDLTFTPKYELKDRQQVVFYAFNDETQSYTLPYLFQSVHTANVAENLNCCVEAGDATLNYKLSICDSELTNALKYTDSYGRLGSHPNYPPFPLCRNKISAREHSPNNEYFPSVNNPASLPEGYPLMFGLDLAADPRLDPVPNFHRIFSPDWTASITVPTPDALVKTVSSGTIYGHRSSSMEKLREMLPKVYPLWDRTQVARENVTFGYSYITPNASMLGLPDFSAYWQACNPHTCAWIASEPRFSEEIITSLIAISGGIVMACKVAAEICKTILKKRSRNNVVAVDKFKTCVSGRHSVKVVVAGAQMTTDVVEKEE